MPTAKRTTKPANKQTASKSGYLHTIWNKLESIYEISCSKDVDQIPETYLKLAAYTLTVMENVLQSLLNPTQLTRLVRDIETRHTRPPVAATRKPAKKKTGKKIAAKTKKTRRSEHR